MKKMFPVFKKVMKWIGIVSACIVGLILLFIIVSLFYGGDYDLTGKKIGTFLGSILAGGAAAVLMFTSTEWLVDKMFYSKVGNPRGKVSKTLYLVLILPIICILSSATFSLALVRAYSGHGMGEWSKFDYGYAIFLFIIFLIGTLSERIKKVKDPNELAQAAESMNREAEQALEKKDLNKAGKLCEKALRLWSLLPDDKYPQKANVFVNLGQIHLMEEQYEAAREDYKKGLAIRRSELGDNHRVIAAYYTLIAEAYNEDLEYDEEIIFRRKALETLINTYGEDHEDTARAYVMLSYPLQLRGDKNEALDCLEHALSIRQTLSGPNSLDLLDLYYRIRVVCFDAKDYVKSLDCAEKELLIKQMHYDEDNPTIADSFANIAYTYFKEEDYSKATGYFEKALSIRSKTSGESHWDVATIIDAIGETQYAQGKYREALDSFLKAYHIRTKANDEDKSGLVSSFYFLCQMYYLLGDYTKAHFYAESGRATILSMERKDYSVLAYFIDTEGIALLAKGEYDKALGRLEEALKIRQDHLTENHTGLSNSYINIGLVHHHRKEYSMSLESYIKAISLIESMDEDRDFTLSICYIDIAETYSAMGNYEDAIRALHKADNLQKNTRNESHRLKADILSSYGKCYYEHNDNAKAIEYLKKAIVGWEPIYGPRHPSIGNAYYYIGKAYLEMGNNELALEHLKSAKDIQKEFLGSSHPDYLATLEVISHINDDLSSKKEK